MAGRAPLKREHAEVLARQLGLSVDTACRYMRESCLGLPLNPAVVELVQSQRAAGRRTALVTVNIDLFSEVVVPDEHFDEMFDVIVNSAHYGTLDKRNLWPLAFDALGPGHWYETAWAIDDNRRNVEAFRELGGHAYHYTGDNALRQWLRDNPPR